jgi:hypothetical protein
MDAKAAGRKNRVIISAVDPLRSFAFPEAGDLPVGKSLIRCSESSGAWGMTANREFLDYT